MIIYIIYLIRQGVCVNVNMGWGWGGTPSMTVTYPLSALLLENFFSLTY